MHGLLSRRGLPFTFRAGVVACPCALDDQNRITPDLGNEVAGLVTLFHVETEIYGICDCGIALKEVSYGPEDRVIDLTGMYREGKVGVIEWEAGSRFIPLCTYPPSPGR